MRFKVCLFKNVFSHKQVLPNPEIISPMNMCFYLSILISKKMNTILFNSSFDIYLLPSHYIGIKSLTYEDYMQVPQ